MPDQENGSGRVGKEQGPKCYTYLLLRQMDPIGRETRDSLLPLENVHIRIEVEVVHYPSVDAFFPDYLSATPVVFSDGIQHFPKRRDGYKEAA